MPTVVKATIVWLAMLYVDGKSGDTIECQMTNVHGVLATKSVKLEKTSGEIQFYFPNFQQDSDVDFSCLNLGQQ